MVATVWKGSNMWNEWTEEQKEARKQELLSLAAAFAPFTNRTDRYRADKAGSSGGFFCADDAQASLLRSAIGEIIAVSHTEIITKNYFRPFVCLYCKMFTVKLLNYRWLVERF